jgi:hypothetical protein
MTEIIDEKFIDLLNWLILCVVATGDQFENCLEFGVGKI